MVVAGDADGVAGTVEVETDAARIETVDAGTVETKTTEREIVEAEPVELGTVETETVEAEESSSGATMETAVVIDWVTVAGEVPSIIEMVWPFVSTQMVSTTAVTVTQSVAVTRSRRPSSWAAGAKVSWLRGDKFSTTY